MQNLIIGVVASFVVFIVFFIVFAIRSRRIERSTGSGMDCGHAGGQCRCRSAEASIQPYPPPEAIESEKPCPGGPVRANGPKAVSKK